jgi:thioredoxin-related protein
MKKIVLFSALACLLATHAIAQENKDKNNIQSPPAAEQKPFEKSPALPEFKMILRDSATFFNTADIPKGKPIMLVFFDPDCKHCKDFTKDMVAGMESLKNVRIYMITTAHNMKMLREFYDNNHLGDYPNIMAVGRDVDFFYVPYFGVTRFPDIAIYSKRKKLIKHFQGEQPVSELVKYIP